MAAHSPPVEGARPSQAPPDGVADAAPRRGRGAAHRVPSLAWAAAAMLVVAVGVSGTGGEGEAGRGVGGSTLHLPPSVGRAGSSLYSTTVQFLMDRLAPPPPDDPARWVPPKGRPHPKKRLPPLSLPHAHKGKRACLGAVYREIGGGSRCVGAFTATLVVGLALVVQFLFYVGVLTACPYIGTDLGRSTNVTNVLTIALTNGIDLDTEAADMTQTQDQQQDQEQNPSLNHNIDQDVIAAQSANVAQDQSLPRAMFYARDPDSAHTRAWLWGRGWTLPPLDLCRLLSLYF